jgi:hypothetical protein
MHFSLPTLLILSLKQVVFTRLVRTVVACFDFISYVSLQGFTNRNETYAALNYIVTTSLGSAIGFSIPVTPKKGTATVIYSSIE